ncbi:MAG: hypothetical protein J4452_01150 [Candidatus Aenigmarchaeota archaeon]|nr:hypothetical protein [Candidatus Aenigmarchaeota archaeon]
MIVASFTRTVEKLKILPRAETRFWLVKFVCPFCYFVKTLSIDLLSGNRYFTTLAANTLWYYCILKGKWKLSQK